MRTSSVFDIARKLVHQRSHRCSAALGLSAHSDEWRIICVRLTLRLVARARSVAECKHMTVRAVLEADGERLLDRLAHDTLEPHVTKRMISLVSPAVEDYGLRLFHGGDRTTAQAAHAEFRRLVRDKPSGGHSICDCSALLGRTARRAALDALEHGTVRTYRFLVASAAQDLRVAEGRLAKPQVFAKAIVDAANRNREIGSGAEQFCPREGDHGLVEDLLWHLHGWDPPVTTDGFMERLALRHLGSDARGAQAYERIDQIIRAALVAKPVMRTSVERNVHRLWADRFHDLTTAPGNRLMIESGRSMQSVPANEHLDPEPTPEWLAVKRCLDLYAAGTTSGELLGAALAESLERLSDESRVAMTSLLHSPQRLRRIMREYRSGHGDLRADDLRADRLREVDLRATESGAA